MTFNAIYVFGDTSINNASYHYNKITYYWDFILQIKNFKVIGKRLVVIVEF